MRTTSAWQHVEGRDRCADGIFVYAVRTTGIFCRPSCPSRRPAREHVEFFSDAEAAVQAGYRACKRCRPQGLSNDAAVVQKLCAYLARNRDRRVTLDDLGKLTGLSKFTAQRIFLRVLKVSPSAYQRELRARALVQALAEKSVPGRASVTDAICEAGYSSPSQVYAGAADRFGMSPGHYKRELRGSGPVRTIRYATLNSTLGELLIAATEKGLCAVTLGRDSQELTAALHAQFPAAELKRDDAMQEVARQLLAGQEAATAELDLDIRATAFQLRVWQALKEIPRGQTRSYAQVAREIGQPTAVRAVARACATNPLAVIVPCHRVVGSDGALTGYRWGLERKKKLLELESRSMASFTSQTER